MGTGSRVGRELAQPGGLLPGQAFAQAGRPSLPPGPPHQPVRAPSLRLSGARRSPRASPPASGHSLRPGSHGHPATTAPPQPLGCLILPREGRRPEEGRCGGYFRFSPFLLAVAPRPELHIFRVPFSFRAEGSVCYGQGLFLTESLAAFRSTLQPLPFVFPFKVFKAQHSLGVKRCLWLS